MTATKLQLVALQEGGLRLEPPKAAPRLQRAFGHSVGTGLLDLLYHGLPPQADPALSYLHERVRQAAMQYLRHLRQGKEASFSLTAQQAQELLAALPPITGASISVSLLQDWFACLNPAIAQIAAQAGKSPEQWLTSLSPAWQQLGMLCLHLAENAGDGAEQAPFAFLATFVHRISNDESARHMPLGLAARSYGEDKTALLALLRPLQEVAAGSPFWAELIRHGHIYQACAWSAKQCYDFLCSVPLLETQGIETRMVKLWKNLPPRVELEVQLDCPPSTNTPQTGLQLHSILQFSLQAVLGSMNLSDEELEQLMQSEEGLIRFKGEWVRLDREQLQKLMSQWKTAIRMNASGIPLLVGLRYLLGKRREALPQLPPVEEESPLRLSCGEQLQGILDRLQQGEAEQEPLQLSPQLAHTLRPYQRDGAAYLNRITSMGLGACLADDMGLGKSIQIIAWLCHLAQQNIIGPKGGGAALIIAPASLLHNWREEIARFAPELSCCILHPQELNKSGQTQLEHQPENLLQHSHIALTSYGIATRNKSLAAWEHPALILDEAQAIKNASSQRTQALLHYQSPRRIAISGTPVENKVQELHSLFNFLNPGLLGSSKQFDTMLKDMGHDYSPLKQLLRPFLLRRLKSDKSIAPDLPEKIQQNHPCYLTPEQAQLYAREVDCMQAVINESDPQTRLTLLLPILTHLKQICNHPAQYLGEPHYDSQRSGKMQQLRHLVQKFKDSGESCIVFTQYRSIIPALEEQLRDIYGQSGLQLHGGTPVSERQAIVRQFQQPAGPPYIILSLKAAGTGLTLTRARHVIHYDRWWNPAVEAQASDRAHRIGQTRNVHIHTLTNVGSIEDNIHRMIAKKQAIADELLNQGLEGIIGQMSGDELMQLVRLRE